MNNNEIFNEEISEQVTQLLMINENLIESNEILSHKIKVLKLNLAHTQKILNKTIDDLNKRIKTLEIDAGLPIPDFPVFLGF